MADRAGQLYFEPARSYRTAWGLFAAVLAGFLLDVALGAGTSHVLGWLAALVLVVGADTLAIHAARSLRSVIVTADEVRVGEDAVTRADIVSVDTQPEDNLPVLGRRYGEGVPNNAAAIGLQLADGRQVVVASRHPDRLLAALDVLTVHAEIRPAEQGDLPLLAEIDARAESLFRVSGLDLPALPFEADAAAVFVAGRPAVGFALVDVVDDVAHLHELAVLPSQMRHGLGSALLEAACEWAISQGYQAITLCTYADVPWNGPFYRARGFAETAVLSPGLVALREWETVNGLDVLGRRIVMLREL